MSVPLRHWLEGVAFAVGVIAVVTAGFWIWQGYFSRKEDTALEWDDERRKRIIAAEQRKVEQRLIKGRINLPQEEQPRQVNQRSRPNSVPPAPITPIRIILRTIQRVPIIRALWSHEQKEKTPEPQEPLIKVQPLINPWQQSGGRLLILGEPGSGKTTRLLGLAEELLKTAKQDPKEPLPVLFELSAWRQGQSILDWLAAELKKKYSLKQADSKQLILRGKILPLMDGLDELELLQQRKCVEALNQYLAEDDTRHLVVCCRREEYEQVEGNLKMHKQLSLLPLSDEQIQDYLTQLGKKEFWHEMQHQPELKKLLQTPLFLSVLVNSYRGQEIRNQSDLWNAYIERQLRVPFQELHPQFYKSENHAPKNEQTLYHLTFLAKQLQRQTEFLIEQMQPTWLEIDAQRWWYQLVFGLVFGLVSGLVFGLVSGILAVIFVGLPTGLVIGLSAWLVSGLVSGLIGRLFFGRTDRLNEIKPIETFQFSMTHNGYQKILNGLFFGLFFGLLAGLLTGHIAGLVKGYAVGLVIGRIVGLIFGVIVVLVIGLETDFPTRSIPNQGIWASFKNTLIITALIWVLALPLWLVFKPLWNEQQVAAMLLTSLAPLSFAGILLAGGLACIQHIALRIVLYFSSEKRGGVKTRCVPWNYAKFLNYAESRRLIQEVGGSYRFIHETLMEHFANMA